MPVEALIITISSLVLIMVVAILVISMPVSLMELPLHRANIRQSHLQVVTIFLQHMV